MNECCAQLERKAFQARIARWMQACFGPVISSDRLERGDRLLEEVFELLQAGGYPPERIAALEAYTWSRPIGDPVQETGGVMVTLAAWCQAFDIDMEAAAEAEYDRISRPEVMEKIRRKQAMKPKGASLPVLHRPHPANQALDEAARFMAEAIQARQETCKAAGGFPLDDAVIADMERKALDAYEGVLAARAIPAEVPPTAFTDILPAGVEIWMVADALAGMTRSEGLSAFQKQNARLAEKALRLAMRQATDATREARAKARVNGATRLVALAIKCDTTE